MSIPTLTDRERAVLAAVIDSFVRTAAPVGSQKIGRDYEFEVSAATIRNTMADLEAKGLLTHPHTSAGRLPTDLAYRYYVDGLMRRGRLTPRERVQIEQEFIGLEVAAALRALDKEVTVIEAAERLMGRTVSREVSSFFLEEHRRMGTDIRLGAGVSAILGKGRAEAVRLSQGTELAADLVLIAAGVVPNDGLARAADLATDNGILVDHHMTTSDPRIFAIGDCATFHSPFADRLVRLESVQNAVDQAKLVAETILAGAAAASIASYRAVPWFWSDQGPFKLQIVGLTAGADHVEMAGLGEAGKLVAYCFKGDRLLGIETVNRPGEHMLGRRILAEDLVVARGEVARHDFDLKAHVAALKARG